MLTGSLIVTYGLIAGVLNPAPVISLAVDDILFITKDEGKAPGKPTEADGYHPPKRGAGSDGTPVKNPNGTGKGWLDDKGNVWVPTGEGGAAHGGPHWDVQKPGGGYVNVYPGGRVR